MKKFDRREFLRRGMAATALAATPGMAYTQMAGGSAAFADYRALVCVFLHGGNDSYNMLVPRSTAEYNAYAASRQNLAIPRVDLLPISPASMPGSPGNEPFGLHPAMAGLQTLFESGQAAFVSNVGPLIEPTTLDQYQNKSVLLPPQLFSHNDQQDQWASLKGRNTSKTGWGGRMADLIRDEVPNQQMAINASLHGSNLFQSADQTFPYVMGAGGPEEFQWLGWWLQDQQNMHRMRFEAIVDAQYNSVYERGYAEIQRRAIDAAATVTAALTTPEAQAVTTPFPATELGTQLQTVAKIIAARTFLQMQRQIFFVGMGGFDTHDNQVTVQPRLLMDISDALAAFYAATVDAGVANSVTTFTQSDFGRTLTSNGDGTDHAWAGNQVVIGDAVNGREIYGDYPVLEIGSSEDVGGGRMIPSTSADQYAATLAKWFGIPDVDLEIVAPSLSNFAQRDLGFMMT
jgi:uncharacterized protein (DUF1501 family)